MASLFRPRVPSSKFHPQWWCKIWSHQLTYLLVIWFQYFLPLYRSLRPHWPYFGHFQCSFAYKPASVSTAIIYPGPSQRDPRFAKSVGYHTISGALLGPSPLQQLLFVDLPSSITGAT